MQITFWGVRGSYPVPGAGTVRYGGQTSCVEVRSLSGACLIVDAGTGLRALGQKLAREQVAKAPTGTSIGPTPLARPTMPLAAAKPTDHHILLSHVHWDHIQGLPFFEPAYIAGNSIHVYALLTAADELQQVIGGITRHEFFPMPLEMAPAQFRYLEVLPGNPFCIADFEVLPIALNHPFGSVGYRVAADGVSWAYIADTAPFTDVLHKQHFLAGLEHLTDGDRDALLAMRRDLVTALRGVDTVVYDTHFLPEEYARFPHYGHSTPDQAIEICREAGVRRLVLYHHAPSHNDEQMDVIAAQYAQRGAEVGVDVVTSREGMNLVIGGSSPSTATISGTADTVPVRTPS